MQTWQLQTAKARFSELVKQAADDGPQEITVHGRSVAVVVSKELFDRLSGNEASLVDFMRRSPLYGSEDISFERDRSLARELDL
ncbi:MAG TPA: type II toxin-antitoxin system Phd/YefM family antitoxin [Rubrivivax sp.]|nr:type II toxin-antitoxin system Phd/YefM family antitoxin [Rubrivivax sp.]